MKLALQIALIWFILVCLLLIIISNGDAGLIEQPSGYYVMQGVDKLNVKDSVIQTPSLSGFHVRSSWSSGWSYLDSQVARAERLHKQVTLGVYAGTSGHQPIGWTWAQFDTMVQQEGIKYANNNTVVAVHISCPDTIHSMEMFPPAGISSTQLLTDWKRSINDYNVAFPNKALVLDIAPSPVTNQVIAYAEQTLGQRFNPIMDSLHATTNTGVP